MLVYEKNTHNDILLEFASLPEKQLVLQNLDLHFDDDSLQVTVNFDQFTRVFPGDIHKVAMAI